MKTMITFIVIILSGLLNGVLYSQDLGCDNIEPPVNECYAPWRWF
jgi:hypothetical protein